MIVTILTYTALYLVYCFLAIGIMVTDSYRATVMRQAEDTASWWEVMIVTVMSISLLPFFFVYNALRKV